MSRRKLIYEIDMCNGSIHGQSLYPFTLPLMLSGMLPVNVQCGGVWLVVEGEIQWETSLLRQ